MKINPYRLLLTVALMSGTLWMMEQCRAASVAAVNVEIPEKFYWADNTALLPKTDFMYTEVSYGECSDTPELLKSIMGGTNIWAGQKYGRINYVPTGRRLCFVATVMGPDRLPIGRSNVVEFAISPNTRPGEVLELKVF